MAVRRHHPREPLSNRRRPRLAPRRLRRNALLDGPSSPHAALRHEQANRRPAKFPNANRLSNRRLHLRLRSRSHRTHPRPNGLNPGLLSSQRRLRPLANNHPTSHLPSNPRPRHGRRMVHRRRPDRRNLAPRTSRQSPRHNAIHMGHRRNGRGSSSRPNAPALRLARRFLRRNSSRASQSSGSYAKSQNQKSGKIANPRR